MFWGFKNVRLEFEYYRECFFGTCASHKAGDGSICNTLVLTQSLESTSCTHSSCSLFCFDVMWLVIESLICVNRSNNISSLGSTLSYIHKTLHVTIPVEYNFWYQCIQTFSSAPLGFDASHSMLERD